MPPRRPDDPPVASRATIMDVAQQAKVSAATVSRVMNESAHVSEEMTRAVLKAAAALEFRPNFLGRSLRSNRTHKIGVVLPTLSHPVFAECLEGLEDAARKGDHAVVIATTGYDAGQEDRAIETLLRHRVDGLVLTVANAARSRALDKLDRERVPYVLAYNQLGAQSERERPTVSVDNRAAARQMVDHLIALGHRRIVMVAGSFRQSDRTRLRHRGYQDALRGADLTPLSPVEVPFMADDSLPSLRDLLSAPERPTALFCSSDQLAMRVVRDLGRMGWSVPGDISVAGFDGVQLGLLTSPTLSTVVQPSQQIASTAVDLLLGRIAGLPLPSPAVLPHALRVGESTAAPSKLPKPLRAASRTQRCSTLSST